jgi:predicted acyl esterase
MKTVGQFPRRVQETENQWITLADGCRLAARIWLPADAAQDPVPAILEYLPYRKRDGTAVRDELTHPYFAGHGYACLRVDMRGNGESDGLMWDEYLKQEQDDALEVIDWIAAQPWCTGKVGMIGISWGGSRGRRTRPWSVSAGAPSGWSVWRTSRCSPSTGCVTSAATPSGSTARSARTSAP